MAITAETLQLVLDSSEFNRSLHSLNTNIQNMSNHMDKAQQRTERLQEAKRRAATASGRFEGFIQREIKTLFNLASAYFTVAGAIAGTRRAYREFWETVEAGQAAERLNAGLTFLTGSAEGAREELEFLKNTAQDLGIDFEKATNSYTSFAVSLQRAGLAQAEVQEVFLAISEASTALGLSGQRTELVLKAFEQIGSKGKASLEELRKQLSDHLPGAMAIAAESMGMTTEALEENIRAGNILAHEIIPALGRGLREELGDLAAQRATESEAAFNRFRNAVFFLRQELAIEFLPAMADLAESFTRIVSSPAFSFLAQEFGQLISTEFKKAEAAMIGLNAVAKDPQGFFQAVAKGFGTRNALGPLNEWVDTMFEASRAAREASDATAAQAAAERAAAQAALDARREAEKLANLRAEAAKNIFEQQLATVELIAAYSKGTEEGDKFRFMQQELAGVSDDAVTPALIRQIESLWGLQGALAAARAEAEALERMEANMRTRDNPWGIFGPGIPGSGSVGVGQDFGNRGGDFNWRAAAIQEGFDAVGNGMAVLHKDQDTATEKFLEMGRVASQVLGNLDSDVGRVAASLAGMAEGLVAIASNLGTGGDPFAVASGAIGAAGSFIGLLEAVGVFNEGAPEATATLTQSGNDLIVAVSQFDEGMSGVLEQMTSGIFQTISQVEQLIQSEITTGQFGIKIRDGLFTVFINGLEAAFSSAQEAIFFATQQIISTAGIEGPAAEALRDIAANSENMDEFLRKVGLLSEVIGEKLDPAAKAAAANVAELAQMVHRYGLESQNVTKALQEARDKALAPISQWVDKNVDPISQAFDEARQNATAYNNALQQQVDATQAQLDMINQQIAAYEAGVVAQGQMVDGVWELVDTSGDLEELKRQAAAAQAALAALTGQFIDFGEIAEAEENARNQGRGGTGPGHAVRRRNLDAELNEIIRAGMPERERLIAEYQAQVARLREESSKLNHSLELTEQAIAALYQQLELDLRQAALDQRDSFVSLGLSMAQYLGDAKQIEKWLRLEHELKLANYQLDIEMLLARKAITEAEAAELFDLLAQIRAAGFRPPGQGGGPGADPFGTGAVGPYLDGGYYPQTITPSSDSVVGQLRGMREDNKTPGRGGTIDLLAAIESLTDAVERLAESQERQEGQIQDLMGEMSGQTTGATGTYGRR